MKKLASLCVVMIIFCTCYYSAFAGAKIKHIATISAEGSDSTKHHPKEKKHPTVGGSTWTLTILVQDQTAKPISGATVLAPCTGWPAKTTNTAGMVSFTCNAPCTCTEGVATITTPKGCSQKIAVLCDSIYTVTCNQ